MQIARPVVRFARCAAALCAAVIFSACAATPASPSPDPAAETATVAEGAATFKEALRSGDVAWRAGDADLAAFHYGKASRLDPASDVPYRRLAALADSRGQNALAQKAWTQVLQRSPEDAEAEEALGYSVLRSGDADSAIMHFTRAISLQWDRWRAIMGIGLAAEQLGRLDEARAHFDAALVITATSPELLTYSAELYLRQGELKEGLVHARLALALSESRTTRLVLGDLHARSSNYAGALEAYLMALDEPSSYQRLGEEAYRSADYPQALRFYRSAIDTSGGFNQVATRRIAVINEQIAQERRRHADVKASR